MSGFRFATLDLAPRSRRYLHLHTDPTISCRTNFFAAAAIVTRVLSLRGPSAFVLELSATLEEANASRARLIRTGELYADGTIEGNTRDFVRFEQGLVQQHLEKLRQCSPRDYLSEIGGMNAAFELLRFKPLRNLVERCFVRAVEETIACLGAPIDVAQRACREALGVHIAEQAGLALRQAMRPNCGPAPADCGVNCPAGGRLSLL